MIIYIHVIFNNHYIYQLYPVIPTIKGGSLHIFITVYNITYFIWLNIVNDPELRQIYSIWSPITIYILISDIGLIYIEILYMIYIPDIIISGQNWSLLVIKSRSENGSDIILWKFMKNGPQICTQTLSYIYYWVRYGPYKSKFHICPPTTQGVKRHDSFYYIMDILIFYYTGVNPYIILYYIMTLSHFSECVINTITIQFWPLVIIFITNIHNRYTTHILYITIHDLLSIIIIESSVLVKSYKKTSFLYTSLLIIYIYIDTLYI